MKTKQEWKICDCLDGLPEIPDKYIDMIITDLPFEITQNKWDVLIPADRLWYQYERIIKDMGTIVLFGSGVFSAEMMLSNKPLWRYNLIWKKGERSSGFLNANIMPLRNHEDILVFYKKPPIYNPQFRNGKPTHKRGKLNETNNNYGKFTPKQTRDYGSKKFPLSILDFDKPHPPIHPTQKPLALIEYLIKTYTNEGDMVHDSCLGSGTTLEACMNLNRNCIGFEIDPQWEPIYRKRLRLDNTKLDAFNTSACPKSHEPRTTNARHERDG